MSQKDSKPPRAKADTAGTIENIKLVRTGVLCNGELATYSKAKSHNPRNNAPNSLPEDLDEVSDALFALNDLQLRRHAPVHPLSLAYALQSLLCSAPDSVQAQVMIPGPTLSDELFGSTEDFEALASRKRDSPTAQVFWEHVRQKEFVLWPVQSDSGIWSTIVLHLGMSKDADFDTVTDFAFVDAAGAEKEARVVSRLGQLLDSGGIDFHSAQQHHIWVPPQAEEDSWESGIRCFELIRQLVSRLTDGFCNNQSFEWDQAFGPPTRGWLNVDFIRHEMMGMALERCNTILNYSCRYALEPIMDIRLADGINLAPDCLAPTVVKHAYIPGTDIAIENGQIGGASDQEEIQVDLTFTTTDFENSPDDDQIGTGEPEGSRSKRPNDSASNTLSEEDSETKRIKTE